MKKAIILIMTVVLLASMVIPAMAVLKGTDFDVPTKATVGTGGGSKPIVKVKWELADDGDTGCGVPRPADVPPKTGVHPDDRHEQDGTQMAINPSDIKPMTTYIVATDPDGRKDIQGVFIDIFSPVPDPPIYPKQKHGVLLGGVDDNDPAIISGPMAEAVRTRLGAVNTSYYPTRTNPVPITQAEYDEICGPVLGEIVKRTAYAYKIDCSMNYHDPAGLYTVKAYAVDKAGNLSDPVVNQFLWVPTKVLEIDFENGIDFSPIQIGTQKSISGDEDLLTPLKPTVKNEGNVELLLSLKQDPMIGLANGKAIYDFDVDFLGDYRPNFKAGDIIDLANPLPLCNTKQIDFSVFPNPASGLLLTDTYIGKLHLWVR